MGWEKGGESSCRGVNVVCEGQTDFYKVLGVNYDATDDSIRSNYLRLALKWHPDKHVGEDGATLKFQEINEAYRVLSDPAKRLEYDMKGDFVQEYSIIEYLNRFKGLILTCNGLGISTQNKWAPHTLRVGHLEGYAVALLGQVTSGLGQENVKALVGQSETVVMSALDWQIIKAENMVAAFQDTNTTLFATAANAHEARLYFEALEKGTDGVVLQTEDPAEVVSLKACLASRSDEENRISLQVGTVVRVEPTGLGDRVCVDLCNIMNPGEGLLVGSFARGLFLVHSECLTSGYVASRPFRVNAWYRSSVVNAEGKTRPVTVGRGKSESRPLMLVEVEFELTTYSLFLQNAETVCLVSPSASVLISLQGGARHTGLEIDEFIVEK
ncbi:hypothetical protein R1flu_018189 [Riccia fluitans]|uniref:J domain-containing protein n=1 Tax=Riccia fluitans TaxID=41844 RepID=A0ABD1ZHE5_9MARC